MKAAYSCFKVNLLNVDVHQNLNPHSVLFDPARLWDDRWEGFFYAGILPRGLGKVTQWNFIMTQQTKSTPSQNEHLNAEFLIALANGAPLEDFNLPAIAGENMDINRNLADVIRGQFDIQWKRKPAKRNLNGFWVNAPETVLPQREKYYVSRPDLPRKYIETKNCNEFTDRHYLSMGLVFLTAEDAIANANAMCMIDPGP